jgi:hypothetical protein
MKQAAPSTIIAQIAVFVCMVVLLPDIAAD